MQTLKLWQLSLYARIRTSGAILKKRETPKGYKTAIVCVGICPMMCDRKLDQRKKKGKKRKINQGPHFFFLN